MTDNDAPETNETVADATDPVEPEVAESTPSESEEEEEFSFVEDPVFDVDYKGDCAYEVKVTIPPANEQKEAEKLYDDLTENAELPGFRKGRAPRKLVERKFSKYVRKEIVDKLVSEAFKKLVGDQKLRPLGALDIDGIDEEAEREEGAALTFTLKFEVAPRVELGKYRGLDVERPVLKVEDKDIDQTIDDMRSRYAVYESVEGGTAQHADQVIIGFRGTIDGEEFAGGKAENYPYVLGSQRFFGEFEKVLTGSKVGEEKTCDVTFPEDYSNKSIAGKTAAFTINVNEIKRRNAPDLNDEFAQQAGFEHVEDLKAKVAARLRERVLQQSDSVAAARLLSAVIEASTFEFPKTVVDSMFQEAYEEEIRRLRSMHTPQAELRERDDDIRARINESVLRELREFTVLNEIADAEGIEATDEDFEAHAADIGSRYGMPVENVVAIMQQDEHRNRYEMRILREKAVAVLLSSAQVKDVEVDSAELQREFAESEEQGEETDDAEES